MNTHFCEDCDADIEVSDDYFAADLDEHGWQYVPAEDLVDPDGLSARVIRTADRFYCPQHREDAS